MASSTLEAYRGDDPFYFVCYSHEDSATVFEEMQWLYESGINLWYDEGIEVGTTWRRALAEALDEANGLIFFSSRRSLVSTHCQKELSYALDAEKPIFVVCLDDTPLTSDLALYLNDTQRLDRDRFERGIYREKLLRALDGKHTVPAPSKRHSPRRYPVTLVAVVSVLLAGSGYWYLRSTSAPAGPTTLAQFELPRIAIMPMEVLTEDETLVYLARASEEDLRAVAKTSIWEPVDVPESASSMSVVEIGEAFEVDYVWYRNAARQNDEVRITKRLAETRTGRDVSVFQHELEGNDPFALQDQLAKYTEEFMWAVSQGETERADGIPLADMNAFELMLTSKGARLENNRRALALAPDFFLASTHVAQDLFFGVVMGQEEDTEAIRDEALQLARRGWQLAPLDPQASSIAAQVEMGFGDPAMAARYVNHLLELKSTSSAPLYLALIVNDRVAEGLTHAKANPLVSDLTLCHLYLAADRLPEAVRHCQMATDDNPFGYLERMAFANVLGYLDRRDDVEDILRGVGRDGALASVAAYERGARAFWGSAEFTDKLVGGLKRLGFE